MVGHKVIFYVSGEEIDVMDIERPHGSPGSVQDACSTELTVVVVNHRVCIAKVH